MKNAEKELLIIIPAYNEKNNIEKLLDQMEAAKINDIADVLIINDASSDGTNRIVKRRGYPVITHVFNLGYGSALQIGYKYAVRRSYQYVIQMDADGQHDVCNIKPIYYKLKETDVHGNYPDIVLGSRFMEGSKTYAMPRMRKLSVLMFRKIIKILSHKVITDPTSGLQGLNWRTFLFYSKYNQFDDKFPDANVLIEMILLGFRVEEIPVVMNVRTEGESMHSGLKPIIYMVRMGFSILAAYFRVNIIKKDKNMMEELRGIQQ